MANEHFVVTGATPVVSVIIPHLDTPELLARCLASVTGQTLRQGAFEVIVVDNGSRISIDAVRAAYPQVRFMVETAPGPGHARNTGAAAARAPIFAFIDADCRAEIGWLQAAVDAVDPDPVRTVVGGDVRIDFLDPQHLTPVEAYEAVFAYRQRWYIAKMKFSGTGNLALGREVLAAVGPFAGIEVAEDRDWGRRANAAGFCARYVEPMRIFHPGRTSFAQLTRKWERHIGHDFHDHVAAGRSIAVWQAKALAVLVSGVVHASRVLTSDRLSGAANRWRGIGVLIQIRAWRCREMLRVSRAGATSGAAWRRT